MRRYSLSLYLVLSNMALALLPLLLTGAVAFFVLFGELRRSADRSFAEAAALVGSQVSSFLTTPARLVSVAARGVSTAAAMEDGRALDLLIGGLRDGYPAFTRLELYGPSARLSYRYPPDPERLGDSVSGREFYRRALALGETWSTVFLDVETGNPTVAVASKGAAGVLAGFVDLSALQPIVDGLATGGSYAAVLDAEGIYIAHPDRGKVLRRESARLNEAVSGARVGSISVATLSEEGRPMLCAAVKDAASGWIVALFRDRRELYAPVRLLLAAWGVVVAISAGAAALFAAALARRVARPFQNLASYAASIGEGAYPGRAPEARFNEISGVLDALSASVVKVAERESQLKKALAEREALAREIQHRVKNNLAVLIGLLSLAEEDASGGELELLSELRGRVFAMSAVHELSYAKRSYSEIDAAEYLTMVLDSAIGRGGRLTASLECDGIRLPVDVAIPLGLAANELVVNAAKYAYPPGAPPGSALRVSLSARVGGLRLVVSDDGVGLGSAPSGDGRHGTGLELVTLLASQLRGRLELGRSALGGVEAVIDFPLSADPP